MTEAKSAPRWLKGRDPVSPKIADKLGFERLTVFVKKEKR